MISVENVTRDYVNGKEITHVLKDVSFKIGKGEFVAIMGPSGSGKSTLMHILGALDTPTAGTYWLDGKNVSALPSDELARIRKSKIGFVFQAFHLLPRATVLRNVMLPLVYAGVENGERERRAKQALLSAGLPEDRHLNLTNQLSGGQMQRVAIARALVNDPAIILADEPTGNLDPRTSGGVFDALIAVTRSEGLAALNATHNFELAARMDRAMLLHQGRAIEGSHAPEKG